MAILNKGKEKNKKIPTKKAKKNLFSNWLLLKQTLVATWKSKLQLVILLLLTAFATSLVTGSWIAYTRMIAGSNELGLNNLKFDAVLPYSPVPQGIKQIANQAFSLKLGRFYDKDATYNADTTSNKALYFDDTRIGNNQEILPITKNDLTINYIRDGEGKVIGVNSSNWTKANNPLTFNLNNDNVKASIYGQLLLKAMNITNSNLKNHLLAAANDLYHDIFLKKTAPAILTSITTFIKEWIAANLENAILAKSDDDVTTWILNNKVNFRSSTGDLTIPDSVNLRDSTARNDLFTKLVKKTDIDPKLTNIYGMNGQWMRIYRNFDAAETDSNIFTNFINDYNSPFDYNMISDDIERDAFSIYLIRAASALQMRDVHVYNQFTASAGVVNNTQINTKIIDIGLPNALNRVNLKVFEGVAPTSKNEIVINPQYARKNNSKRAYKPGDHININDTDFIVSGIGGDAYNIYPTINDLDPIPNTRTEFIAYVTPAAWNDRDWYRAEDITDSTLIYFTPWNDIAKDSIDEFNSSMFDDFFQKTIFNQNGKNDLNQYDYNKYLVAKYATKTPLPLSAYLLISNPVITSSNSEFSIYTSRKVIFNSAITAFLYAVILGILFLLMIVIFITSLIVKKSIQHGQVSMGILKSIGYKTWQIVISYLAYPLLTLLIAIPIGWISGLVIQIYLTEIFNTLFILPYNVFNFDIIPLFIAIALIISFIVISTLLTAFLILKRDTLLLIKKDSDLVLGVIKNKGGKFLQNNFRFRFLLSLSKTSWKKILITSGVIALASFSIVATTAIPTTINSLKTNYFKTQKYKNYYQYQTPMPNMPMSKYGLYSWNFFNRPNDEKYYPSYGAMPWPEDKIIYDKNNVRIGWYNPLLFKITATTNNFASIFTFDSSFPDSKKHDFLNKMGTYYQNQATGTLDLNDLIWSYSWFGGKAFSNQLLTDLSEEDNTANKIFSSSIINFATGNLPAIIQVPNPGVPPGPEAIKAILKQVLPGFVRQSIDSLPKDNPNEVPYDYFTIGHNTIAFNPKSINNGDINGPDEELVTQFKVGAENAKIAKAGFMDIIGINPNTAMLVLQANEVNDLKYSDNATTIPMVINRAFQSKFGLKIGSQFAGVPQVNTLYYKNIEGKSVPLPKENWYYGKEPPTTTVTTSNNGSIWSKNGTKWSYRGEKEINLSPTASDDYYDMQGTKYNGMYDNNGQPIINDIPNTWNNVNDIWLKLPADISPNAKSGKIAIADNDGTVDFDLSHISNTTGEWIKPFSYDLIPSYSGYNPNDPLSILLSRPPEWFMGMINNNILTKENNVNADSLAADIKNNMPLWWQNITGDANPVHQYQVVGIQDSYDSPKAYIDQKWANKIIGYNYLNDDLYYSGTDILQWFNGKLSANINVFDLIGRMSFKANLDDYTIYATTNLNGNKNVPIVANTDLLSRQQAMLTKMSDIAFSASALFIVATIICSILIVIMITDLFTDQFRRFMAHMKAEGYTNWEINAFTLGIFTPWAILGYIVGFALGFLAIYGLVIVLINFVGVALPFTITWWILPASFVIIGGIYISTFIINNYELNKMNLIELLKSDE